MPNKDSSQNDCNKNIQIDIDSIYLLLYSVSYYYFMFPNQLNVLMMLLMYNKLHKIKITLYPLLARTKSISNTGAQSWSKRSSLI